MHTFDCTVKTEYVKIKHPRINFHEICIGSRNRDVNNRKFRKWSYLMNMINLNQPPTVLKMDVEGFEHSIISDILKNEKFIPNSISLEIHYQTQMKELQWYGRFLTPYELSAWMDYIFTRGGFVLSDRNDNKFCSHCSEIVVTRIQEKGGI